jgi:AcrR family transcriptional regulator
MTRAPVERAGRSDARRNRARLTEVAAAAFRDEGLDVGVDEIARRAGVGVATLYRHFPSKTDLIQAVMDAVLDDLDAAATKALGAADPEHAVARFLKATLALQCRNRGFLEALAHHDLPAGMRDRLSRRTRAILEPVVAAGHATGAIRAEVDAGDMLVVVRMLGVVSGAPRRRSGDRYLAILLRGLAASPGGDA